jgi:hypothetical protein
MPLLAFDVSVEKHVYMDTRSNRAAQNRAERMGQQLDFLAGRTIIRGVSTPV